MIDVVILGASGSIGQQSIDVILHNPNDFNLVGFSVGNQTRKISTILKKFPQISHICIKNKEKLNYYSRKYKSISFYYGDEGLIELIDKSNAQMVVDALVGFVGMIPAIHTLKEDKILCLANKESLVVGGEIINKILASGKGKLFPIDSEHVALAKCLSVDGNNVEKLIITASGGSFRNLSRKELENVTVEDALNHPTWKMGKKITIDSATMVNKTFEIIEAHYLFNYPLDKIDVILHKESHVHSMVMYSDGTYRMDVSKPDMRVPIKYALYQGLLDFKTYYVNDYRGFKNYSFKEFDYNRYPAVKHAKTVIEQKGSYGAVLNAANEEAVYAFLNKEIKFLDIEKIIDNLMCEHKKINNPSIEDLIKVDRITRNRVHELIKKGV